VPRSVLQRRALPISIKLRITYLDDMTLRMLSYTGAKISKVAFMSKSVNNCSVSQSGNMI